MYYSTSDTDPEQLVGRFAKVVSCSDKAWIGAYGEIFSYRVADDSYEMKSEIGSKHLKSSQLQLFSPQGFLIRYPHALKVKGSHAMTELPARSIIDFSNGDPHVQPTAPQLTIKGPCRIVGAPITQTSHNLNSINNRIVIDTENDDDLVEFDSVYFEPNTAGEWWVECLRGQVVFRRCMFVSNRTAIVVGKGLDGSARVVIESCTFTRMNECVVEINCGNVTIVNCAFVGIGVVAVARDISSTLDFHHCTLQNCSNGVIAIRGAKATIKHCNFQSTANSCVSVSTGARLRTETCISTACAGSAIIIEGNKITAFDSEERIATDVHVIGWQIQQSKVGIRIGSFHSHSAVDAGVYKVNFHECKIGTFVCADVTGELNVSGCTGAVTNCVNISGDKCNVYVDGVEDVSGVHVDRLNIAKPLLDALQLKPTNIGSSVSKRALQKTGIIDIKCAKCSIIAPVGTMFKKCHNCREVRYCSRECQKQHYPTHTLECSVISTRKEMMFLKGYISCDQCGRIETGKGAAHKACARCVKVFYCGRLCQVNGWPQHKHTCNRVESDIM